MKPKHTKIVLIIAIVGIWAAIIYQFIGIGGEEVVPDVSYSTQFVGFELERNKTELNLNYRDPFLGDAAIKPQTNSNQTSNSISTTQTVQKTEPVEPVIMTWPEVNYMGMVRNINSDDALVMITINGKSHIVGKGDVAEQVTLVDYWRDSALVALEGEKRMVWK